jgi:sirohydrochlorin ferrochelatase
VRACAASGRLATITVAGTLGGPGLSTALDRRVAAAADVDGWVLAGTGSSRAAANNAVHERAAALEERSGRLVRAGFVTCAPGLADVVAQLRSDGAHRIGVLPWFLAPGRLLDRAIAGARRAGARVMAEPLADDPDVAAAVWARHDTAVRRVASLAQR